MIKRGKIWPVAVLCAATLLVPACQRKTDIAPKTPAKGSPKPTPLVSEGAGAKRETDDPVGSHELAKVVTASGRELYLQHCATCHGEFGDGDGKAAVHLHPRPRNFRGGKFMCISTESGFPSNADLDSVLVRGMPGSAMPSFAHLDKEERRRLIEEVLHLCRTGVRDSFVQSVLRYEDVTVGEIEETRIQEYVDRRTTAGPSTKVPEIEVGSSDSIERGKDLYVAMNCQACHGPEGKGDGKKDMIDQDGLPTKPRDFTRGIFKGEHDPQSLYRRVAYGMPGSSMPSHGAVMTPEQIVDVVQYTLSLSDESQREAAILKRSRIVAEFVEQLPSTVDSAAWNDVQATQLRMTPLWWRQGADPDLSVRALHDGENITFRLSWRDATRDQPEFGAEKAADIAALELFRGDAEPFIGMGSFASPVDVWRWTARLPPPLKFPATLSSGTDQESSGIAANENSDADATEKPKPSGNENSSKEPEDESAAGKKVQILSVEEQRRLSGAITGFGAGSFNLELSQLVQTKARWQDNVWTIELTRPLAIKNNLFGVSLEPGCNASVAFAIWNGSKGDKGGNKAITIWQDLHVEALPKE